MPESYAYIRVSTKDQNEARQVRAMLDAGVAKDKQYIEKQSGKDFNRPVYQRLVKRMKPDDVLYIKSIDRLGRNYEDIQQQWRYLTKEKQIDIVVLDMPLLDTRRGKDLMGTFLADIVLQVLSFVAENERAAIRQRQKEGIQSAKARGVRFGRPPLPVPANFAMVVEKWRNGEITLREAAKACHMAKTTFASKARKLYDG
ncbi:MAG: recombinase family protein [Selenomonas sp.]|nr:recombinase family protein [Selenomonas sp.]